MALKEITFKVQDDTIAKDIIKASLNRELMLLKKSLSKTKEKLEEYERKNKMSSDQFYRKFREGISGDTQEVMLWAAECESLKLLAEKQSLLEKMLEQCSK